MSQIIELILSDTQRGLGIENSPVRTVLQLWTKDGRLVAERDPCDVQIGTPDLHFIKLDQMTDETL